MNKKILSEYPDIYFEPSYARLYEKKGSKAIEYELECEYGLVSNLFLLRPIDIYIGDGIHYNDIITPYGYGGPVIRYTTNKSKLIDEYKNDFQKFAVQNHIVTEFVRFHPLINNGIDFKEVYQSVYDRNTVGTNLTYKDVIATEFSKHKRKTIRKILKDTDIRYEIDDHPESLEDFIEIYYSTMERDGAGDYYYFTPKYFQELMNTFPNNIITGKVFLRNKLIAMGIYFRYGEYLHAHLSGTLSEYLKYSPAYILKYALALYGHDNGYKVIHYGGGSSNSPDNGLYRFKRDFGKNTEFDFYISRKIWNKEVYRCLCQKQGVDINSDFFPAYRIDR